MKRPRNQTFYPVKQTALWLTTYPLAISCRQVNVCILQLSERRTQCSIQTQLPGGAIPMKLKSASNALKRRNIRIKALIKNYSDFYKRKHVGSSPV